MFGMDRKKKKATNWEFDLEKLLANPVELRKHTEKNAQRVQQLKSLLRQGKDKQTFESTQTLLHAYLACPKVWQRIKKK